jgi:DNA-binding transcriptional regulator YhcF (GntR family)
MKNIIQIDPLSPVPKYQQLTTSIVESIENGVLARGEFLPSINEVSNTFSMARMTVTKAYEELRQRGLIDSRHGKGFFVTSTDTRSQLRIFALFDALTPYKEVLYDSMIENLGSDVSLNIFFHHHNLKVFENLILDNLGHYNYYAIMPHFNQDVVAILQRIPKDKLLILDIDVPNFGNDYALVYQDFYYNMYNGLLEGKELLKKYESISLVLSSKSFQYTPVGLINGFLRFCEEFKFKHEVVADMDEDHLKAGKAYIVFREHDVIRFLNWSNKKKWQLGKDIGLLSYDDTPIKEILAEGISVISSDFKDMGRIAAEMILMRTRGKIRNKCMFIKRNSL